ncbi:MAG: TolC family protein [Gemmatimonadaceae bacterium]|nr:TolC family protein [Gemmatimonadaceae bacterium]
MSEPTKQQLLDAAVRVYAESGFRGATTRKIAEAAGVNEVTLFRLFGSKAALIEAAVEAVSKVGSRAKLPETPQDPVRELTAWAEQDHRFMLEIRGMIRMSMAEMAERPECAGTAADHPSKSFQALTRYIERLAAGGFIPSADDAKPAAAMLMGTLFADAMGRDMMPESFPPERTAPATYVRLFLKSIGATLAALLLLVLPLTGALAQQPAQPAATPLSLADALQLAERRSLSVRIAEAGTQRAAGQMRQADAQRLPQVNGTAAYQRAIQNQFQAISERFAPDTGTSSGGGLENSPLAQIFAAPNTFTFTVSATQNLWTGGKVSAARAGARAGSEAASIQLSSARAQALLDVAQAYFDAVAAERLKDIADSTLALTERTLRQVELARSVGTASEFDLLRARVTRDNQRPLAIQATGNRTAAQLRLKQLLELPLNTPLTLTTPIRDDSSMVTPALAPVALDAARTVTPDTAVEARATVRQATAQLEASERALTAARLAPLPNLQLSTTYQRFAYPPEGTFLPGSLDLYFPNWNVTLGLSFPIFTGGRVSGERAVAQSNVLEARARLEQARDGAELDAILSVTAFEQAQAAYLAAVGTDAQAEQAYRIAEVRFAEGISTPVELTEARVQLEQARLQRVTTARDLEVARLRLALLKDLPLAIGGAR